MKQPVAPECQAPFCTGHMFLCAQCVGLSVLFQLTELSAGQAGTSISHLSRAAPCKAVSIAGGVLMPWEGHCMALIHSLHHLLVTSLNKYF